MSLPPANVALWEILVPCNWNDRVPIRTRHHKAWDKRVREIIGGMTILQPGKGQWIDPSSQELYEDRVIPVRLMATEAQMEEIAAITAQHYAQRAVMYFKVSEYTRIYHNSKEIGDRP